MLENKISEILPRLRDQNDNFDGPIHLKCEGRNATTKTRNAPRVF